MSSLPSSRAEAVKLGAHEFFTGKPCKYGHTVNRRTANSHCVECKKLANKLPINSERALAFYYNKRHRADYRAYTDFKNKIRAVNQAEKRYFDARALQEKFPDQDLYTREGAKLAGMKYYFTGKSCSRGHLVERNTGSGQCIACSPLMFKAYYDAHKDELKASAKERYDKMMETCREEFNARKREYNKTEKWKAYNREYQRKRRLDPAYLAQQRAYGRDYDRRKKAAAKAAKESINIQIPKETTNV